MSRAALRFLTVAACALLLMGGAVGVEAAPVSVARSLESVRLAGVDYIELDAFCRRFGLKPTTADGRHGKVGYASKWTSLEFEVDSRECAINTLRVFLGDPLRSHRGRAVIGLIDAERLLTPILLPGPDGWAVPALKTIVIDPGHGGGDPGTGNKRLGINEKTMTLDTARRLKKLLDAAGYKTILTRNSDRQLADDKVADLLRRDEIASQANADLFISVHYNSIASGADRVSGVEVYRNGDLGFSQANRVLSVTTRNAAYAPSTAFPADSAPYVWRVRRTDPSRNPGPWSATGSFVSLGSAPQILGPAAGSMQRGNDVVLVWSDVPGAASYEVSGTSAGGGRFSTKTVASAFAPSVLDDGTWTWRVRALDAAGALPTLAPSGRSEAGRAAPSRAQRSRPAPWILAPICTKGADGVRQVDPARLGLLGGLVILGAVILIFFAR